MGNPESNLPPGFRFHPTDEELILHYLGKKVASVHLPASFMAEVDIYKFDPWDLPAKAAFGDKEWYFFSPRDRKYPNGCRPNRAAGSGFWKATGTDKTIVTSSLGAVHKKIGLKKALVFYTGKPPKGDKTKWMMHEYRVIDDSKPTKFRNLPMRLDEWVLCRIFYKSKCELSAPVVNEKDLVREQQLMRVSLLPSIRSSPPRHNTLISQKSLSFSNLLDASDYSMLSRFLYENYPYHPPGFEPTENLNKQSSSNDNSGNCYLFQNTPLLNPSPPNPEQYSMPHCQLPSGDENYNRLYPSNNYPSSPCNFPNTENPRCNIFLKQSWLNQKLLLGPHPLFQG